MNINGKNGLACLTNMRTLKDPIVLKPLPGLPVVRDLIVDMTQFFKQYNSIKPYLVNDNIAAREGAPAVARGARRAQRPVRVHPVRQLLHVSCPSFWWNPDKFVGPAGLLQAYRFIADSRDEATGERLDNLEDPYRLFRCHTIMNCVDVCPKGLNPTKAIGKIKEMMVRRSLIRLKTQTWNRRRAARRARPEQAAWRCRRGLLENDLLIERFFDRHAPRLTVRQAKGLGELMDLADNDLLDLLLRQRRNPKARSTSARGEKVLQMLRRPVPPRRPH
jgi:succinate dehydrogenase / fumarate reductase iron-sulfur subunit